MLISVVPIVSQLIYLSGCLIVEVHDHRDQPPGESVSERVVLWPNDETIYAEISLAAAKDPGKWTDLEALTYEANHLVNTLSIGLKV